MQCDLRPIVHHHLQAGEPDDCLKRVGGRLLWVVSLPENGSVVGSVFDGPAESCCLFLKVSSP